VKKRSRTIPLIEAQIGPDGSVFNALCPVIDAALKKAKLFDESLDAEYRREALMAREHQRNMLKQASEKMFVPVPPESINVASSLPVQQTPVKRKLAELLEYSKASHSAIEQKLAKEAAQAQGRRAQKMFVRKHGTDVDTVNVDMGEYTDADRKLARLSLEYLEGKRERRELTVVHENRSSFDDFADKTLYTIKEFLGNVDAHHYQKMRKSVEPITYSYYGLVSLASKALNVFVPENIKELREFFFVGGALKTPLKTAGKYLEYLSRKFSLGKARGLFSDVMDSIPKFRNAKKGNNDLGSRKKVFSKSFSRKSQGLKAGTDDIKIGKQLGEGGNKLVYDVVGSDDLAIAVLKKGKPESSIDNEIALLEMLDEKGLARVKIINKATYNGQPAIVMKKYAQGSKEIVKLKDGKIRFIEESDIKLLNEKSIQDLTKIRNLMVNKKLKIDDLQFLISKDGGFVIADPLKVYLNTMPSTRNLKMIDLLIRVAKKNINK